MIWDHHLPYLLFVYHASVHESMKKSPFYSCCMAVTLSYHVFTGTAEVVNSVEDKKPQTHSPFYMTT